MLNTNVDLEGPLLAGHGRMVDDPFRQRTSTQRPSASTPRSPDAWPARQAAVARENSKIFVSIDLGGPKASRWFLWSPDSGHTRRRTRARGWSGSGWIHLCCGETGADAGPVDPKAR